MGELYRKKGKENISLFKMWVISFFYEWGKEEPIEMPIRNGIQPIQSSNKDTGTD